MSSFKPNESSRASGARCSGAVSRAVLFWVAGGLLAIGVAGWWLVRSPGRAGPGATMVSGNAEAGAVERPVPVRPDPGTPKAAPAPEPRSRVPSPVAPRPLANATPTAVATTATPATPAARELVKSLHELELGDGGITAAQAQQWKSNLWNLVQSGAAGAAAIREFMEQNTDYNFASLKGGNQLGFLTLRTALVDALASIGGPEATAAALHALQSTAEPREIALLGRALEQLAPGGDYRVAVADAARNTLALAAEGKLEGADVTPLFETFVHFGDSAAVLDLQTAVAKWENYGKIALAQLPGGSGVPGLIALANNASSPQAGDVNGTYGMLAQAAVSYPDAASALLEQARANRIPESAWPAIASALSGVTLRLSGTVLSPGPAQERSPVTSYGSSQRNQQWYSVRAAGQWTPEQIQQQIHLIDGLVALNPGSTAVSALQNVRNTLAGTPSR